MRLRTFGLAFGVVLAALIVGCGGGGGSKPPTPSTLAVTTTSPLTPGTVGVAYSATVAASGGTAPYTWSVSSGTLPAGLSLSSAGALTGTPTAAGTSTFSLSVSDSGSPAQTATLAATLVIAAAPPPTLVITTTSPLTPGTVGVTYSATLAASGGTAPYTWAITTGTLPAGLTLSTAGALTGTPTAAGTFNFTITATDSASTPQTATLAATLVIAASKISVTTPSPLPAGTLETAYVATLAATGGTAPYTWSVAAGTLPAGLTLSGTGIISGTPTAGGMVTFTVQAADAEATPAIGYAALTVTINVGTLAVQTSSLPSGSQGVAYVSQLGATGGVPPYTWAVATSTPLPAGLSLSSSGLLSGTPTGVSNSTLSFTVTDVAGTTAMTPLALLINPATGTIPDGQYSFVFSGTAPQGTPVSANAIAINGTFTIKSGSILSGFYDENTNTNPALIEQAITGGTLTNGTNGLGQLVLTTSANSMTFALATPASVAVGGTSAIRIIEFDDANGSGSRGSGVLKPAIASPATSGVTGNYAFLLSGTDIRQRQQALIGSFQTDGSGNLTNGNANSNQEGVLEDWDTLSGTYSIDANGRGSLKVVLGGDPFSFSFYEVSPGEWFTISLDPATLNSPLVSGSVLQQTGGPFTTASLPTTGIVQLNGLAPVTAGGVKPDISLGLESSNGAGTVTFDVDEYNGVINTGESFTVNYALDPVTGRALSTGSSSQPILYVINPTSAFVLGPDQSTSSGIIEQQTGAPFTNASFSGNYLGGSLPLVDTAVLNEAGLLTADGAGNVVFTTDRSTMTGLTLFQSVTGTYAVDATGRVVVTAPDGITRILYVISPAKIAYLSSDTGGYLGSFQQ